MTEMRHIGYEQLLEDFGQRLEEAAARRPGGQRRRRAAAGALVLPGIVAIGLLLAGGGGGRRLPFVAQARAALAPAGQVVHLVTTSHMEMRGGAQAEIVGPEAEQNAPRVSDEWSASQPVRWRIASVVPIVTAHGTFAGPVQLSYGDGTEELYVQPLNTLDIRTGVSGGGPRTSLAEGPLGAEPVPRIRSMLEAGQLREAGGGTVNGHAVERLVGAESQKGGSRRSAHAPWPVEYDVDPKTFAPVRFTVEQVGTSIPGNSGTPTDVVEVSRYEELPLNEATASLLSIRVSRSPTIHRSSR